MEYWDIYDVNRSKTNRTMIRGEAIKEDDYHLVVHICIFNSNNQMLIQQRQPFKEGWPNKWDISVGGSAVQGDSSQKAAERETFEELGLKISLKNQRPCFTINFDQGFDDVYLVEMNVNLDTLTLQKEEVQKVKWATKEEILEMIECGEFIPFYPSFIDLLFASRHRYGVIS